MNRVLIYATLTGIVSLGLQLVFNRLIFFYLVNTDFATVTVISLHLTGFMVGAFLAGRFVRISLTHAFIAFPVLVLAAYVITWRYGLDLLAIVALLAALGISAFAVALISGFIIGRLINDNQSDHKAAKIIIADTFGSVVGAVAAGFFLLPHLGIAATFLCFAVLSLGLSLFARPLIAALPAAAYLALAGFYYVTPPQPSDLDAKFRVEGFPLAYQTHGKTQLVASTISPFGVVSVIDTHNGMRVLHIDNMPLCAMQTDGRDKDQWSEWEIGAFGAKLAAQRAPAPKIAIIGLGCGLTLAGALSELPADAKVTMIEINPRMPEMTRQFTQITGPVLDDPRVQLEIADGFKYFMERNVTADKYDAIIVDITWMRDASLTHMFSHEYFSQISGHLTHNGIFGLWNDASFLGSDITSTVFATIQSAYPNVVVRDVMGVFIYLASRDDALSSSLQDNDRNLTHLLRMGSAGAEINTLDNLVLNRLIFGAKGGQYSFTKYLDKEERRKAIFNQ